MYSIGKYQKVKPRGFKKFQREGSQNVTISKTSIFGDVVRYYLAGLLLCYLFFFWSKKYHDKLCCLLLTGEWPSEATINYDPVEENCTCCDPGLQQNKSEDDAFSNVQPTLEGTQSLLPRSSVLKQQRQCEQEMRRLLQDISQPGSNIMIIITNSDHHISSSSSDKKGDCSNLQKKLNELKQIEVQTSSTELDRDFAKGCSGGGFTSTDTLVSTVDLMNSVTIDTPENKGRRQAYAKEEYEASPIKTINSDEEHLKRMESFVCEEEPEESLSLSDDKQTGTSDLPSSPKEYSEDRVDLCTCSSDLGRKPCSAHYIYRVANESSSIHLSRHSPKSFNLSGNLLKNGTGTLSKPSLFGWSEPPSLGSDSDHSNLSLSSEVYETVF